MKNVVNVLKLLLYFVIGYLLFAIIISLIEFIFLIVLSNGEIHFLELLFKSIKGNLKIYTITYLVILILNLLYNFISIKILNAKLNKIKKG